MKPTQSYNNQIGLNQLLKSAKYVIHVQNPGHIHNRVISKVPQKFVPPFRDSSIKSSLESLVSEPNFDAWVIILAPPLSIQFFFPEKDEIYIRV